jgi:hypothetical protein
MEGSTFRNTRQLERCIPSFLCYNYSVEGKRFIEIHPFNTLMNPIEDQPITTNHSTIDLATLNTAQGVMVAALRGKVYQWEQDSADAAANGNFSTAAAIQQWAIAADLLLNTISIEFSVLFSKALTARFDDQRSIAHY